MSSSSYIADLDLPQHYLPIDPVMDPCHKSPSQSIVDSGDMWCYRRCLVAELSTMLSFDEDVIVDMNALRRRITQCERWEKALNHRLAQELNRRREMLSKGEMIIAEASREVCLALVSAVNSRRALDILIEEKVSMPIRALALARRRHRLALVRKRLLEVKSLSRALTAYRRSTIIAESIHAALELQKLLGSGVQLPSWMRRDNEDKNWTHPAVLLTDIRSNLAVRLKPLALVDDITEFQNDYVDALSGYWQLLTLCDEGDINPATDICCNFCNLVATIARQCLLAATNLGGPDMDEVIYNGRKTLPVCDLCHLLDHQQLPHFAHRLLEVYLSLIIRYDRLIDWHAKFKGEYGMECESSVVEFINNLSAELTARRELVLERIYKQLQVLLESLDIAASPISAVSDICGLIEVFRQSTKDGSDSSKDLFKVMNNVVNFAIRDCSLRMWTGELLALAQKETWKPIEASDPLIPHSRTLRTMTNRGQNVLSKPSITAAIYNLDLSGVSSMVSPRWPLLTQALANRMGELLQLGVVHPSVFGLLVARHPTFDDVVSVGNQSRPDVNDRHAIYESHDKFIANRHYHRLSRQFFKLRQLIVASGSFNKLLLNDVHPTHKLRSASSLFGLRERCSALKSCSGLLTCLRHRLDSIDAAVDDTQERYISGFISTTSDMIDELSIALLDDCAASIVNQPLAKWTQQALRHFGSAANRGHGSSSSEAEDRKSSQLSSSDEADVLVSSLDNILSDARANYIQDPLMLQLLAVCMYRRVAQQAGEITGLIRPMAALVSDSLHEYLGNISASLALPGMNVNSKYSDELVRSWGLVLGYTEAFKMREGSDVLEWCESRSSEISLRLLAALMTCVCPDDAIEGGMLLQLERYVLDNTLCVEYHRSSSSDTSN